MGYLRGYQIKTIYMKGKPMKASSKIKTVTGVMMVVVMVGLTACGKKEAAETQSTKDDISNYYQEELELDKESADELAEIAMEINDIEDSEGAEEEAEVTEEMELINSCFDEAIDNTLSYIASYIELDKSVLYMTEEELVASVGKPDSKDGSYLIWKLDGEHIYADVLETTIMERYPALRICPSELPNTVLNSVEVIYPTLDNSGNLLTMTDFETYYENAPATSWAFFDEFFLNEDGSLTYDSDQVSEWGYDDFVEALGNKGIMFESGYTWDDSERIPTITIAWFFPADGNEHWISTDKGNYNSKVDKAVLIAKFDSRTGNLQKMSDGSFSFDFIRAVVSSEQP